MRIRCTSLQIALVSLLVSTGSAAVEPPHVKAIRVERGPIIDGVLDDEVWQRAEVIDDFTQVDPQQGAENTLIRRTLPRHANKASETLSHRVETAFTRVAPFETEFHAVPRRNRALLIVQLQSEVNSSLHRKTFRRRQFQQSGGAFAGLAVDTVC